MIIDYQYHKSMRLACVILSTFIMQLCSHQVDLSVDVAVWGATAPGIIAAISAARTDKNLKVAVIAPSAHVGGMTSGGLGCVDAGNGSVIGGITREFYTRMGRHYGLPNNSAAWRLTPAASEQMLRNMLAAESNIVLVEEAKDLLACSPSEDAGTTVSTATTRVVAWVWIDSTYEGDLIARCGVPTTFGRESNSTYNETLAGIIPEPSSTSAGHVQFNVDLDPYSSDGHLLPQIPSASSPPATAVGGSDKKVMAYTFRVCITNRPDIRVPFARPSSYDPREWELLSRYIRALGSGKVDDYIWRFALPEGKFDVCNYGPLSTHPVGMQVTLPSRPHELEHSTTTHHALSTASCPHQHNSLSYPHCIPTMTVGVAERKRDTSPQSVRSAPRLRGRGALLPLDRPQGAGHDPSRPRPIRPLRRRVQPNGPLATTVVCARGPSYGW